MSIHFSFLAIQFLKLLVKCRIFYYHPLLSSLRSTIVPYLIKDTAYGFLFKHSSLKKKCTIAVICNKIKYWITLVWNWDWGDGKKEKHFLKSEKNLHNLHFIGYARDDGSHTPINLEDIKLGIFMLNKTATWFENCTIKLWKYPTKKNIGGLYVHYILIKISFMK